MHQPQELVNLMKVGTECITIKIYKRSILHRQLFLSMLTFLRFFSGSSDFLSWCCNLNVFQKAKIKVRTYLLCSFSEVAFIK